MRIACDSFWLGTMMVLFFSVRSRDERQPIDSTYPSSPWGSLILM